MTIVSTTVLVLAIAFLVVAALAALVSVAVVGEFLVTNRRARLSRHESIRTYYRGFALTS
jgi:hypothetical protein